MSTQLETPPQRLSGAAPMQATIPAIFARLRSIVQLNADMRALKHDPVIIEARGILLAQNSSIPVGPAYCAHSSFVIASYGGFPCASLPAYAGTIEVWRALRLTGAGHRIFEANIGDNYPTDAHSRLAGAGVSRDSPAFRPRGFACDRLVQLELRRLVAAHYSKESILNAVTRWLDERAR